MVSLLDCIERVPQLLEAILENRPKNFAPLLEALHGQLDSLDEIVLIGSGTSNTSAITARIFMEKASGLKTTAVYPNDFCYNTTAYKPHALYVFISQTGTSIVVRDAQKMMQERGCLTACLTESPETPMAKEAAVYVEMGCGEEEYLTRTIGYSTSVFTLMLMGLEIGLARGNLTKQQYDAYLQDAARVPNSHRTITKQAMAWMDGPAKRQMLRSRCLVFTGADALQGVALEAAVKVWEILQHIAIGYELEEGLHGANYGYNYNHCVLVLNHGGRENEKALALAKWMKDVYKNGLVIGNHVVDENDLQLNLTGGDFDCLEIAPVVQIIAYRTALDEGRDLYAPHDNSVMERYFKTHG